MSRPRHAFTLIEILVVVTIIALLVALILAGSGILREKTEWLDTRKRIDAIENQMLSAAASGLPWTERVLSCWHGRSLRWAPLREVLGSLVQEHGLELDKAADWDALPPGITSIYDHRIGCFEKTRDERKDRNDPTISLRPAEFTWRPIFNDNSDGIANGGIIRKQPTFDNVVLWWNKRDFTDDMAFVGPPQVIAATPPEAIGTLPWDWLDAWGNRQRTVLWWHRERRPEVRGKVRMAWTLQVTSPVEENLDATFELLPPDQQATAWYIDNWPILAETMQGETFVQHAWPDSDWDGYEPGQLPPILEMPFGQPVITRRDGEPIAQHLIRQPDGEEFSLADFSPLHSIDVLRLCGALTENEEERYRNERGRELEFNDRWGNPLIVASAFYLAPRYDLDPSPPAQASHGKEEEFSSDLHGGRDWLRRRARDVYGYTQATWHAVAAVGEHRGVFGDSNEITDTFEDWEGGSPLTWTPDQDRVVLRAAWLQVSEVCAATDYRSSTALAAPWSQARRGGLRQFSSLLAAPVQIR